MRKNHVSGREQREYFDLMVGELVPEDVDNLNLTLHHIGRWLNSNEMKPLKGIRLVKKRKQLVCLLIPPPFEDFVPHVDGTVIKLLDENFEERKSIATSWDNMWRGGTLFLPLVDQDTCYTWTHQQAGCECSPAGA